MIILVIEYISSGTNELSDSAVVSKDVSVDAEDVVIKQSLNVLFVLV